MVEESISRAYVKLIRTAERFIYIENQYFLGSAYAWHTDSEVRLHSHLSLSLSHQVQCHHTIPAEIAEKVSEKILEGKQFCAYIVIPLHPEGDPAASATQEILAWQVKFFEEDVVWDCFGFVRCCCCWIKTVIVVSLRVFHVTI